MAEVWRVRGGPDGVGHEEPQGQVQNVDPGNINVHDNDVFDEAAEGLVAAADGAHDEAPDDGDEDGEDDIFDFGFGSWSPGT